VNETGRSERCGAYLGYTDSNGGLMTITFQLDSTTAEGTFIRVLRDGRPFGKILDAVGLYRFYEADREKVGSADLKDANLDRLKTAIRSKYEGRG
jgi:hypothetical protein